MDQYKINISQKLRMILFFTFFARFEVTLLLPGPRLDLPSRQGGGAAQAKSYLKNHNTHIFINNKKDREFDFFKFFYRPSLIKCRLKECLKGWILY